MAFITVFICLLVQWFWQGPTRPVAWLSHLYVLINKQLGEQNVWVKVLVPLVLLLIVVAMLRAIVSMLGHGFAVFLFNVLVLWYCVSYDGVKQTASSAFAADRFFVDGFVRVFALIFWYALFGVVGLVLYFSVVVWRAALVGFDETSGEHAVLIKINGILDWVPLRLVGLSYALVGQFGPTFSALFKAFKEGLTHSQEQAAAWGKVALGEEPTSLTSVALFDRALLVWLVALALVCIGMLMG